jgi:hypothetical protein
MFVGTYWKVSPSPVSREFRQLSGGRRQGDCGGQALLLGGLMSIEELEDE